MLPKDSEAADRVSVAAVFPIRATVCAVPSFTVSVADSVVAVVGVNTTAMVQNAPAPSEPGEGHVPAELRGKSAALGPEMAMLVMVSGSRVLLVSVAVCGAVATLIAVLVNVRVVGVRVWANAETQRTLIDARSFRLFRREYAM
jgi:hypothetical protein